MDLLGVGSSLHFAVSMRASKSRSWALFPVPALSSPMVIGLMVSRRSKASGMPTSPIKVIPLATGSLRGVASRKGEGDSRRSVDPAAERDAPWIVRGSTVVISMSVSMAVFS